METQTLFEAAPHMIAEAVGRGNEDDRTYYQLQFHGVHGWVLWSAKTGTRFTDAKVTNETLVDWCNGVLHTYGACTWKVNFYYVQDKIAAFAMLVNDKLDTDLARPCVVFKDTEYTYRIRDKKPRQESSIWDVLPRLVVVRDCEYYGLFQVGSGKFMLFDLPTFNRYDDTEYTTKELDCAITRGVLQFYIAKDANEAMDILMNGCADKYKLKAVQLNPADSRILWFED